MIHIQLPRKLTVFSGLAYNQPSGRQKGGYLSIVILGWGSLIWDPRDLPREGMWQKEGPRLPVEFSRVSGDGRLTLVIDQAVGVPVNTRYVLSPRTFTSDAVKDLAAREGTGPSQIGFVDVVEASSSADRKPEQQFACAAVRAWCDEHRFNGAVWTALNSNFQDETGTEFSVESVITYLNNLPKTARSVALHYIRSAPEEVITPVRTAVTLARFD
jgi:hypothetical protein